jgi:hypothetical protein
MTANGLTHLAHAFQIIFLQILQQLLAAADHIFQAGFRLVADLLAGVALADELGQRGDLLPQVFDLLLDAGLDIVKGAVALAAKGMEEGRRHGIAPLLRRVCRAVCGIDPINRIPGTSKDLRH